MNLRSDEGVRHYPSLITGRCSGIQLHPLGRPGSEEDLAEEDLIGEQKEQDTAAKLTEELETQTHAHRHTFIGYRAIQSP